MLSKITSAASTALDSIRRAMWSRTARYAGPWNSSAVNRSKYRPHQGPRECARRVKQGKCNAQ